MSPRGSRLNIRLHNFIRQDAAEEIVDERIRIQILSQRIEDEQEQTGVPEADPEAEQVNGEADEQVSGRTAMRRETLMRWALNNRNRTN
ncbi:hypothetical protein BGZ51_009384 [Haplosporangium sp. Z 767]|nr:hypothetical protein BGZ51_009384 [Haplosporangium sp. Z 767]KAF9196055.1 hypothetical protein BGZ50_002312 [Haplosporangium sp. Z 11]